MEIITRWVIVNLCSWIIICQSCLLSCSLLVWWWYILCVCVCVCVSVCVCVCLCLYVWRGSKSVCLSDSMCMFVCVCARVCTGSHICAWTCLYGTNCLSVAQHWKAQTPYQQHYQSWKHTDEQAECLCMTRFLSPNSMFYRENSGKGGHNKRASG